MEAELSKKITEINSAYEGTTGVLLVDKLGLPIESSGNFDKTQSGLVSSIMKNAAKLDKLLNSQSQQPDTSAQSQPSSQQNNASSSQDYNYYQQNQQADITAKVYFKEENLLIRNKQGLTLALRQKA